MVVSKTIMAFTLRACGLRGPTLPQYSLVQLSRYARLCILITTFLGQHRRISLLVFPNNRAAMMKRKSDQGPMGEDDGNTGQLVEERAQQHRQLCDHQDTAERVDLTPTIFDP